VAARNANNAINFGFLYTAVHKVKTVSLSNQSH